jgi:protein-tyrosine phosphatase
MIDTHCHILPMCDDGPDNWNQSVDMAKEAVRHGITSIVATPHHGKGHYFNPATKIITLVKQMNQLLSLSGIPLSVYAGQEYHVGNYFSKELRLNHLQSLANSRYLLIELTSQQTPNNILAFVRKLQAGGYTPVIAHPERHIPFIKEPSKIYELIASGILFQLTADSLVGHFGPKVQQAAWLFARNGWYHLIGSDAHDLHRRNFRLLEAYGLLELELGKETTDYIRFNAEQLVKGGVILPGQPAVYQTPRRWWMFQPWEQRNY